MGPISIDIRRLLIIKFQDGLSQNKIAMDLKIFRHGVQRILTKFENMQLWKTLKILVDCEEMMTDLKEY